ncbi:MAG: right-handed parallel beta-helix repeat-containing protein [Deltaproteobacteria bacterium]|nr:right-handed parallel beta-helix repeat-containing protein [Deltaproteobacteria bacterium]
MRMPWSTLLAGVFVIAALAGCPRGTTCPDGFVEADGACARACNSNADCSLNERCADGACRAGVGGTSSGGASAGSGTSAPAATSQPAGSSRAPSSGGSGPGSSAATALASSTVWSSSAGSSLGAGSSSGTGSSAVLLVSSSAGVSPSSSSSVAGTSSSSAVTSSSSAGGTSSSALGPVTVTVTDITGTVALAGPLAPDVTVRVTLDADVMVAAPALCALPVTVGTRSAEAVLAGPGVRILYFQLALVAGDSTDDVLVDAPNVQTSLGNCLRSGGRAVNLVVADASTGTRVDWVRPVVTEIRLARGARVPMAVGDTVTLEVALSEAVSTSGSGAVQLQGSTTATLLVPAAPTPVALFLVTWTVPIQMTGDVSARITAAPWQDDAGNPVDLGGVFALGTVDASVVVVGPEFPVHGAFFTDWTGAGGDVPCVPSADDCVHAGGRRTADVAAPAGCSGWTATDVLGAFDWTLQTVPGGCRATGTLHGRVGLRRLVKDTGNWADTRVEIRDGATSLVAASRPGAVWWPDGLVVVTSMDQPTAHNIYIITSSSSLGSRTFLEDHVAVVTLPGVTEPAREILAPHWTMTDRHFLWIDADVDGLGPAGATLMAAENLGHTVLSGTWADVAAPWNATLSRQVTLRDVSVTFTPNAAPWTLLATGRWNMERVLLATDANVTLQCSLPPCTISTLSVVSASGGATAALLELAGNGVQATGLTRKGGGGLRLTGVDHRLVNVAVMDSTLAGMTVEGDRHVLEDVRVQSCGKEGILVRGNDVVLRNARASHNGQAGFAVGGNPPRAARARLDRVVADNNGGTGVEITASDSTVLRALLVHNGAEGMVDGGDGNTLVAITSAFNATSGLMVRSWDAVRRGNGTVHSFAAYENAVGLHVENATNHVFSNVAIDDPGTQVYSINVNGIAYHGALLVRSGLCNVVGPNSPAGLTDSCGPSGDSDQLKVVGLQAPSFLGALSVDDPVNLADVLGTAPGPNITDWVGFREFQRAWAPMGLDRGPWSVGSGVIYDWRHTPTDAWLLGRAFDGVSQMQPSYGPGPCPANLQGDVAIVPFTRAPYLKAAVEELEGGGGNGDGLCQSGERCRYAPNIGHYLGESPDAGACLYVGGRVTGVALVAGSNQQGAMGF